LHNHAPTTSDEDFLTLPSDATRVGVLPGCHIECEPGEHLVIGFGEKYGAPGARFRHESILARRAHVFEFKHYAASGRKWWTASSSVTLYFAFRKQDVLFHRMKGMSYPRVRVNGLDFNLNVSGGSCGEGWCDWVHNLAAGPVGMGARRLRTLAEAAASPAELPEENRPTLRGLDEHEERRFRSLCARVDGIAALQAGHTLVVAPGYEAAGNAYPVTGRIARRKSFVVARTGGGSIRVPYDAVDWLRTLEQNGMIVMDPSTLESQ
jgi:hypothetical protein